jgi:hypothetical protein
MATNNSINTNSLTNGQLWIGSTGANPVSVVPTSTGSTITITTGAGSLNFDLTAPVTVANGGTGLTSLTAHGILIGEGTSAITPIVLTAGEVLIGTTAGDPAAATLTAGTGISISSVSGSITISNTGSAEAWVNVTGAAQTIAVNTGYTASNAGSVAFTLPATAAYGTVFDITTGTTAGGWNIVQLAGQSIQFGDVATTTGITGSLASTNKGDSIHVLCTVANTTFQVLSSTGNITYV